MNKYMSGWVSLGIVACGLLIIISILRSIIHKKMPETHGLLWLIPAGFIVVGGCFPNLVIWLARLLNVSYPPAIIFTAGILLLFYLVFRCTMWIANMSIRMQELGMQVSLLNQENLSLLKRIGELADAKEDAHEGAAVCHQHDGAGGSGESPV